MKETLIQFLNRSSESTAPLNQSSTEDDITSDGVKSTPATDNGRNMNSKIPNAHLRFPYAESLKGGGHGKGRHYNATYSSWDGGGGHTLAGETRGPEGSTGNPIKDEAIRKIATLKGNFIGPSFYLEEDFLDEAIKNVSKFLLVSKNLHLLTFLAT